MVCFDEFAGQYPDHVVERLGPPETRRPKRAMFLMPSAPSMIPSERHLGQCPDDAGIGLAMANRLSKAAGFHIINVDEMGR